MESTVVGSSYSAMPALTVVCTAAAVYGHRRRCTANPKVKDENIKNGSSFGNFNIYFIISRVYSTAQRKTGGEIRKAALATGDELRCGVSVSELCRPTSVADAAQVDLKLLIRT